MSTEQRFKLHFETSASLAPMKAAIAEARTGAAVTQGLTAATQAHTAAVKVDESGVRSWNNTMRQTIPQLEQAARVRRAEAAAAINAAEKQRQQQMKDWGRQMKGGRPDASGAGAMSGGGNGAAGGFGGRDPATALLLASQGIEDAQYGVRGVLNNIPGLVMALGGGAGLAGALSIAAVAASQLWEIIGGGGDAVKKSGMEDLKKMASELRGEYESLGEYIKGQFIKDLAVARAAAEKEMTAWRRSIEAGKKAAQDGADKAEQDLAGDDVAASLEKERLINQGTPEEEAERQRKEVMRLNRQNAERRALEAEQTTAVDNLERSQNGLVENRKKVQGAQQAIAETPGQRRAVIDELRGAGVYSDQEQTVMDYDRAALQRDELNRNASGAEQEVSDLDAKMLQGGANPAQVAELAVRRQLAAARAKKLRERANENNVKMDGMAPFVDQARQQMNDGQVTFTKASESNDLLPGQRAALEIGKGNLQGIDESEKAARDTLSKAKTEAAAAEKSLAEFVKVIQAATAKIEQFETRAGAENMEAARNAPLDAPLPALPGQEAVVPPIGPDLPALPEGAGAPAMPNLDIRPQADAISDAMRESQSLVQQAMNSMAETQAQVTQATVQAVGGIKSRMSSMESQIQTLKDANRT